MYGPREIATYGTYGSERLSWSSLRAFRERDVRRTDQSSPGSEADRRGSGHRLVHAGPHEHQGAGLRGEPGWLRSRAGVLALPSDSAVSWQRRVPVLDAVAGSGERLLVRFLGAL